MRLTKHFQKFIIFIFILTCFSFLLTACNEKKQENSSDSHILTKSDEEELDVPEIDNEADYVTPEMYGAKGDGVTDDSKALDYAFNQDKPVKLQSDYYTASGIYCITDNLTIDGNGHTIYADSSSQLHDIILLDGVKNVEITNLSLVSSHKHNPVDIGSHSALYGQKSSNTYGFRIADCENITLDHVNTTGLMYDIFIKRTSNVSISNWVSDDTLMGLYADDTKNLSISDFEITLCPANTFAGCHAIYLCYGVESATMTNGSMRFESKTNRQKTPVFTCHTTNQIPNAKDIELNHVTITGQWPIQTSNCDDAIRYKGCTIETIYPEDASPATNTGQIATDCDTTFENCTLKLNSFDYGIYCNSNASIILSHCLIEDQAEQNSNKQLFVGNAMQLQNADSKITWLGVN